MSAERLAVELTTYEMHRSQLASENEGNFVLIRGPEILGTWPTYEEAVRAGYEKCGLETAFLVKQILAVERVEFITRGQSACQS